MDGEGVFRRKETKYILTKEQYDKLMKKLKKYLKEDKYFKSTICNIYFDTDDYDLIINSINKPIYKEKVRIRSYKVPNIDDDIFLEIKKKYNGIVGKRRIKLKLEEFYKYLETGILTDSSSQIKSEIDYCFNKYQLKPKMFLAYDRLSYCDKNNSDFRITFDRNLRSREEDLKLELGDSGKLFFDEDTYIMETKVLGAYPLWFTSILSSLKVYPTSFSKYGSIYTNKIKEEQNV